MYSYKNVIRDRFKRINREINSLKCFSLNNRELIRTIIEAPSKQTYGGGMRNDRSRKR